MIAMALSCNPKLLIADEPTTALDVTIQAQVLEIMARLSREFGTAVIIITHNLGVVARYADRVNVMYAGTIVETATAAELYADPRHPYTLGLLKSVPRLDQGRRTGWSRSRACRRTWCTCRRAAPSTPAATYTIDKCEEEDPPLHAGRREALCRPAGCSQRSTRARCRTVGRSDGDDDGAGGAGLVKQSARHDDADASGREPQTASDILVNVQNLKMYFPVTPGSSSSARSPTSRPSTASPST